MRQPIVYKAESLRNYENAAHINHRWVLARPQGHNLYPFWFRWAVAWKVLIGKLDAVKWE